MNNLTCPHCGAERDDSSVRYLISFSCGTIFDTDECVTFGRSDDCYERQLAAKDAEIERLKGTLQYLIDVAEESNDNGTKTISTAFCLQLAVVALKTGLMGVKK